MSLENNLIKTLLLIIGISLLLMAPDYIFATYHETYQVTSYWRIIGYLILPLSIGLVFNKYRWFSIICITILAVLQLMQFSCLSYFGRLLTQYDFGMISAEYEDVMIGAKDAIKDHWKVIPTVLIPFCLIWLLMKIKIKRSIIGTLILLITIYESYQANCHKSIPYPIEGRISISNTLKSFSLFVKSLYTNYKPQEYKPYEIKNIGIPHDEPITIVYILGESSNLEHMSLFGYERDTTPNLKRLAEESNFYFTEGIAGGVCTKSSLRFMANVIWEPDNIKLNNSGETSLFKFAKENGFKTFYLASDPKNMVNSVCNTSSRYIDVLRTKESDFSKAAELVDDYILTLIYQQEITDRNFIILHQRCVHTPYQNTFPKDYPDKHYFSGGENPRIDLYDSAMRYNDTLISRIFNRFNKFKGKFYIIWASDHNEHQGYHGWFGHSVLDPKTAQIPVIAQSNDEAFMKKFKKIFKPTHYEIAKLLAEVLGFEIINPNQEENVFYIDGLDYNGTTGYIKVIKDLKNKKLNFEMRRP